MIRLKRGLSRTPPLLSPSRIAQRLFGTALLAVVVSACSGSTGTAQAAVSPRIVHACSVTMGYGEGTVEYNDCVGSIQDGIADDQQADAIEKQWAACTARGYLQGTPAYATCVLRQEQPLVTGN